MASSPALALKPFCKAPFGRASGEADGEAFFEALPKGLYILRRYQLALSTAGRPTTVMEAAWHFDYLLMALPLSMLLNALLHDTSIILVAPHSTVMWICFCASADLLLLCYEVCYSSRRALARSRWRSMVRKVICSIRVGEQQFLFSSPNMVFPP